MTLLFEFAAWKLAHWTLADDVLVVSAVLVVCACACGIAWEVKRGSSKHG